MECFYGDAFLCKVKKKDDEDFDLLPSFKIMSLCNEVGVIDMFFNEYLPNFDEHVSNYNLTLHFFNCYCELYILS
jgi:hypothetical protein